MRTMEQRQVDIAVIALKEIELAGVGLLSVEQREAIGRGEGSPVWWTHQKLRQIARSALERIRELEEV